MYHYHHNLLPLSFENVFQTLASNYTHTIPDLLLNQPITGYINTIKTNYGKFNFRFAAVKVWNHLNENISPLKRLKTKSSLTSYSLTIHEISTGTYLFIY